MHEPSSLLDPGVGGIEGGTHVSEPSPVVVVVQSGTILGPLGYNTIWVQGKGWTLITRGLQFFFFVDFPNNYDRLFEEGSTLAKRLGGLCKDPSTFC